MTQRGKRQNTRQLAFAWGEEGEALGDPGKGSKPALVLGRERALAGGLMEAIVAADNMRLAMERVRSNKGSPGVDGMKVEEMPAYLRAEWPHLKERLLRGEYEPQTVRRATIRKRSGGKRELGIPTVVDRLIQQAILQVLTPIWDPTFSPCSYGFGLGRVRIRRSNRHGST
jgi:RNA-directed DNA polymerase